MGFRDPKLKHSEKVVCVITGPLMGITAFVIDGHRFISLPKWLPKIRNPFVWPQKELDKEEQN